MTDLTGQRFGRLTALEVLGASRGRRYWRCRCDCGGSIEALDYNLKSGRTRSCGCLYRETRQGKTTHGLSKTLTYRLWGRMLRNHRSSGVGVDPAWQSFETFRQQMGDCPEGHRLGRIDPYADYCRANCQWQPKTETRKQLRVSHPISFNGETHSIAVWARQIGISHQGLRFRLEHGWSVEQALTLKKTR